MKSRVSALPDKPEIFNIHLPGPNDERLLLVSDEQTETTHSPVSTFLWAHTSESEWANLKYRMKFVYEPYLDETIGANKMYNLLQIDFFDSNW